MATFKPAARFRCEYKGRGYLFPQDPDGSLLCVICSSLSDDPVKSQCCNKLTCKSCVEKWSVAMNTTAQCRHGTANDATSFFGDPDTREKISNLKVHCPNALSGCCRTVGLSTVPEHLESQCQFALCPCPHQCGRKVQRLHLSHHVSSDCKLRPVHCKSCGEQFPSNSSRFAACSPKPSTSTPCSPKPSTSTPCSPKPPTSTPCIPKPPTSTGPNLPTTCPNSGCRVGGLASAAALAEHRLACPRELVQCRHSGLGCAAVLRRGDLERHMRDARGHHHALTQQCLRVTHLQLAQTRKRIASTEAHVCSTQDLVAHTEERLDSAEDKFAQLNLTVEQIFRQLLALRGSEPQCSS